MLANLLISLSSLLINCTFYLLILIKFYRYGSFTNGYTRITNDRCVFWRKFIEAQTGCANKPELIAIFDPGAKKTTS